MELQDPNIENSTKDSNITNSSVDNEVEESLFCDMSDEVITKMSEKPEKPKVVKTNDRDLSISWDVSSTDFEAIDFFEIQWKKKEEKRWSGRKNTDDNCTSIKIPITYFEKNIAYQFKVRWTTHEGVESQFSDISDDVLIEMSQKPGKPKGVTSNGTDLLINWDVSSSDLQVVDFFELHWKKKEEKRWSGRKHTDDNCTEMKIPITDLEKNIAYQFKVRWTTQEGVESQFSDISDDIIIEMSQKPGKPKAVESNFGDLLISWDVPSSDLQAVDFFELHWKKKEERRWSWLKNTDDNCTKTIIPITDLEKNTAYQFKVRWITQEGVESQFSDISDDIIIVISQKPGKPREVASSVGDLLISWDVPSSDLQAVDFFELHWKKKEERRWSGRKHTDDNCTTTKIPITKLEKNTAYQFKVRWITQEGVESQYSDISDDIIIEMSQKPGKPKRVASNDTNLLISWDVPSSDLQVVDFFEIQWKKKDEKRWLGRRNTDDNSTSITIPITELEKNTSYQFKVRWMTKDGLESMFSETSEDVIIVKTKKPDKPKVVRRNDKELVICWGVSPSDLQDIDYFEIQWKKKEEKRWSGLKCTDDNSTSIAILITEIENNKTFQFKVKWITKNGEESQFSEISNDILISAPRLATHLKNMAAKVGCSKPQMYKIPLTYSGETMLKTVMTRKARFGERDHLHSTKTIMLFGACGVGKSTLIDAMINYIVDVSWEDDFRFTIIEDEKAKTHVQASWQKDWITWYEVNYQSGSRLSFNLNIIDTPGFGGIQEIQYNKQIGDQIHEFLTATGDQGIDSIDAVCFVIQAPMARLTPTQKYMLDSTLSVFGKDIKDNIFILVTFADGNKPPVLAALKEEKVPFQNDRTFTFNNSALFQSIESSGDFNQMFWKLSITNLSNFFDKLNHVQQRSLQLSSEVLSLRKLIENTIECLQPHIQEGLYMMVTMRQETEILEKLQRDIEDNRDFTYEVDEISHYKVDTKPGEYVKVCLACNSTCHYPCKCDSANCCAMGKDGYCTQCIKKCHLKQHVNRSYHFETRVIKVQKTYEELKSKYTSAITGQKEKTTQIETIKAAIRSKGQQVLPLIKTVRECIHKLEQTALKPNPLSEVNNVALLIDSEKREARCGWEARLQVLKEIKNKAELLQKIPNLTTEWTDDDIYHFLKTV